MDIIKERIESNVCPICGEVTIDTKTIVDNKYREVKICKKHYVFGEKIFGFVSEVPGGRNIYGNVNLPEELTNKNGENQNES